MPQRHRSGLRQNGKATYVIRWKELGNFKKMTLGDAKVMSLEDARRFARQRLGEVAGGEDPLAEREARRNNPSLKELGEETIDHLRSLGRSATYISDSQRLLDKWIIPAIGGYSVREVSAKDVEKIISLLTRKAAQDESGFQPLLNHAQARVQAFSVKPGEGAVALGAGSVFSAVSAVK